jgi:hypothetical protein
MVTKPKPRKKSSRSKVTKDNVQAREREEKALAFRKAGLTYQAIAKHCGYSSHEGARLAVFRSMERLTKICNEKAEEVRRIEIERLDAMLAALWHRAAMQGDEAAIDRVLKIQARRAALLGLDAPAKSEHSGPGGGPIKHQHDFSEMTDAELYAIADGES